MDNERMEDLIREELQHISRGSRGSKQRQFRGPYKNWRTNHLSANPDADPMDAIVAATMTMQEISPGFRPRYDHDWFAERGRGNG